MSNKRRFNTTSSLTYSELSGIVLELEQRFKDEMVNVNSESISEYKQLRGKILGLKQLLNELEDYMTSRHIDKVNDGDLGDLDEF